MGANFEERDLDDLDFFPGGWNDADWNLDNYSGFDWYENLPCQRCALTVANDVHRALWNALQDDSTNANAGEAASSSPTFHTASPPRPRLSPDPRRRQAPSSRGHNESRQERSRYFPPDSPAITQPSATTATAARSPRSAQMPRADDSRSRRAETSALAGSMRREISELSEQVSGLQNQIHHLSQSFPRQRRDAQRRHAAPTPTPTHTPHWLDRAIHRPSNSPTNRRDNNNNIIPPSAQSSPASDSDGFGSAIDIDDILTNLGSESEANNMPPHARRARSSNGVVDLTVDSSPASPPSRPGGRKRSAPDSLRGQSSKRRKATIDPESAYDAAIEQLDLTNEALDADEELTAALVAQQNASTSSGPLKIGQRQCIICMEPFTNITITACGHIYCHECLTQALLAGERNSESGKANCPVCRKQVNRKVKNQVIPLSFMTKEKWRGKARRDMAVLG